MHVPKTAGSYLNYLFEQSLGLERVDLHIEARPPIDLVKILAAGKTFISGHLSLRDWQRRRDEIPGPSFLLTSIREPISHLASHMRWLDWFNEEVNKENLKYFPETIRQEIEAIRGVDFHNPKSLDDYLGNLSQAGKMLFDNCQSRYMIFDADDFMHDFTESSYSALRDAIAQFDEIILHDELAGGLERLSKKLDLSLGAAEPQNVSPSRRRIDITDPQVREILLKRTAVDQFLFETVAALQKSHTLDRC